MARPTSHRAAYPRGRGGGRSGVHVEEDWHLWFALAIGVVAAIAIGLLALHGASFVHPYSVQSLVAFVLFGTLVVDVGLFSYTHIDYFERDEFRFRIAIAVAGFVFFLFWSLLVIPYLILNPVFYDLPAATFIPYVIVAAGVEVLFTTVFGGLGVYLLIKEAGGIVTVGRNLVQGIALFIGFSWGVDMEFPPFYEGSNGAILIPTNSAAGENSAVDAAFGSFYNAIGIHYNYLVAGYSLNYLFTYFVTPVLGIILMLFLLAPSQFVRAFGFTVNKVRARRA